ncbi:MAG: hypothetical protein CVU90_03905 [Firmicutes bacterium HGW-Firmicutes-15]|nr:MAG: hypothetical protein CVU90_03905 [Firmicutes bacterium HGW-Firmicutes-15]
MSFDIDNCNDCGKIFIRKNNGDLCPACTEIEDNIIAMIRRYVREHPGQNVTEVSEGMNIKPKLVLRLVRQNILIS